MPGFYSILKDVEDEITIERKQEVQGIIPVTVIKTSRSQTILWFIGIAALLYSIFIKPIYIYVTW